MKLKVDGMTCGGCVAAVTRIIQDLDETASVVVTLESGDVVVESELTEAQITSALDDAGFPAAVAQ